MMKLGFVRTGFGQRVGKGPVCWINGVVNGQDERR